MRKTQTELRGPTVERVSVHVSSTAVTRLCRIVRKQAFQIIAAGQRQSSLMRIRQTADTIL